MRLFLFLLLTGVVLTAIPCGLFLMAHPDGSLLDLPLSLLNNTPFTNFFIPGLILAAVVGGTSLAGLFFLLQRHPLAYKVTLASGLVLAAWILVQVLLLQSFHWLHGLYIGAAVCISFSSYHLLGRAAF
ncbi:hypothetical protein [Flavisolibacter nicotianae]|uniref:hypothetical protein n=1 Tax=Flavisolibacter nicotianae TaxID=2364882 RepID=UPI000EB2D901|nr:hypothetical protein [Flavisolibacter nicotianae]